MANVSAVKAKFFEPQGVSAALVSASAAATTLVIADGGPYGNVTETITLYSSDNNAGNTFTITGTDGNGEALTEDLTGPNAGTVNSAEKYATITSIVSDDDASGYEIDKVVVFTAKTDDTLTAGSGVLSVEWLQKVNATN